jgi:hypothetical protein
LAERLSNSKSSTSISNSIIIRPRKEHRHKKF